MGVATLACRPDPASGTLTITAVGAVTGDDYVGFMLDLARTRPEALALDRVYDLRRYEGSVSHDDLRRLVQAGRDLVEERPLAVVLVTTDRGFVFWAKAIQRDLMPRRRFAVVATPEEVPAALARLRAEARAG